MADVKIKVGAALDSDIANVFRPLIDAAKRARTTISGDAKRATADETKVAIAALKEQAKAATAAARDRYREGSRLNREQLNAAQQMASQGQKAIADQTRERIRAELRLKLDAIRAASRAEIEAAKNASDEARERIRAESRLKARSGRMNEVVGGVRDYMASHRLVGAAGRGLSSAVRAGAGIAGQVARGAGFDIDIASSMSRSVDRQSRAFDLSNSAYQAGAKGAAGQRQDPNKLMTEAAAVGANNAMDPTKVLAGLQGFTAITGDLETGRAVMGDLAKLSKATGTDFDDMAQAAGNVSAQLGDVPDKAEQVKSIMAAIAGQGKLGAVEVKDQAVQMGKLAAMAPQFAGKTSDNIAMMGVLAQEARQRGGSANAAQAATSVASFVSTFSKGARLKAFAAEGLNPYDKNGKLHSPQEIIVAALRKTGGDNARMGKMFMDVRARSAVRGFENIYRDAGGGEKGIKAVEAEFERLKNIAMGRGEIEQSAANAMQTTASKAQLFQNKLDETTQELQAKLLPTLESLQGPALSLVKAFGGVAEFAAHNPFLAIAAVMTGNVVKSAVGELAARALAGGASGALGGADGAVGMGGIATAAGAAILAIGGLALAADQFSKLWAETHTETTFAPGTTEEQKKRLLGMSRGEKQAELGAAWNKNDLENAGYQTDDTTRAGPIAPNVAAAVDPRELLKMNADQLKALQGELKVRIVNVDEINQRSGDQPPPLADDGVYNPLTGAGMY